MIVASLTIKIIHLILQILTFNIKQVKDIYNKIAQKCLLLVIKRIIN